MNRRLCLGIGKDKISIVTTITRASRTRVTHGNRCKGSKCVVTTVTLGCCGNMVGRLAQRIRTVVTT